MLVRSTFGILVTDKLLMNKQTGETMKGSMGTPMTITRTPLQHRPILYQLKVYWNIVKDKRSSPKKIKNAKAKIYQLQRQLNKKKPMAKTKAKQFICVKCKSEWQVQNGIDIYNKFAFLEYDKQPIATICKVCRNKTNAKHRTKT